MNNTLNQIGYFYSPTDARYAKVYPEGNTTNAELYIRDAFGKELLVYNSNLQSYTAYAYGTKDAIRDCESRLRSEYSLSDFRDQAAEKIKEQGGMVGDKMILSRDAVIQGKPVQQRMVWADIEPDSINWTWERSGDEGVTWQIVWAIQYRKKS